MRAAAENATISIVDETTGDVLEGVPAFIQRKQRNGFSGWSQLRFIDIEKGNDAVGASIMCNISKLDGTSARVLLGLLFTNGYRNQVSVDLGSFAEVMGLSKPNLYRSFRRLIDAGVLERGEEGKGWAITDGVMWKGRGREHLKLIQSYKEEND